MGRFDVASFQEALFKDQNNQKIRVPPGYKVEGMNTVQKLSHDDEDLIEAILDNSFITKNKGFDAPMKSGNFELDLKKVYIRRVKLGNADADKREMIRKCRQLNEEIESARFRAHNNIVTYYEVYPEIDADGVVSHICLVSERMPSTLAQYLEDLRNKNERLSSGNIAWILVQILQALSYLHTEGIVHANIASSSFGINEKKHLIKLLSYHVSGDGKNEVSVKRDLIATAELVKEMLNNENLLDVSLNDLLNRMIAKNENVTPPNYFSAKECLEHFSLTDANKRYDREFSFDQPKDDKAWRSKNARNKAILWRLLETPTARINFHIEPNGNRQSMPNQRAPIERFKPENYINAFYKSKDESRQDFRIPQGYSQNKTLPNQAHQMHKCLSHPIELQVITHKDYYDTLFAFLYLPCVDIGVNFVGEYNKASPGWKRVACKRYSCEKLDKSLDGYIRLWRELQVCQMTNHKNIAKFYEFFPEWSEQSISHIWLVSEGSDMTLKQYYEAVNGKGIDVEKLRIILAQILEALSYLHKKGIMHRAIRPENIGVQENNGRLVLKLFNFGLSREVSLKSDYSKNVDTPNFYKTIEQLRNYENYDSKIDIWSTALTILDAFPGPKLFQITGDEIEVANKVRRRGGECAVLDRIFEVLGVQPDLSKLNREGSLSADLKRKITLVNGNEEEVNSLCDLITQMLLVDPKKRLSADVCLKHKFLRPSMGEPMEIDAEADLPATVSLENCTLLKDLKAGRTRLSFDIDLLDAEIKRKY